MGVILGVSGCIDLLEGTRDDDGAWPPDVDGNEPELMPVERDSLRVETSEIRGFQFSLEDETVLGTGESEDDVELDGHRASVSPSPDRQLDAIPPVWQWEEPTAATATIPVYVGEYVESGEYSYSVSVDEEMDQTGESETFDFTITVHED